MNPTVVRSLGFAAAFIGRATAAVAPASIVVFMKSRRFMAIPNPQSNSHRVRRAGFFFGGGAFFGGAG
jgi:hypothetical protein